MTSQPVCPDCGHPFEGIKQSTFGNRIRSAFWLRNHTPQCSSYRTNGTGDAIMCGCRHLAHSVNVVSSIYEAKLAQVDD